MQGLSFHESYFIMRKAKKLGSEAMGKEVKTNAMRFLDKNKVSYEMHLYESDGFMDGVSVAKKLSQPLEKTFKTLVAQGKTKNYYVFVIPVAEEVDMKKAAKAVGEKSVELLPVKELTAVTGYVRGGCSPIGMKKQFPTIIHESAGAQDTIMVSGGRLGSQIELNPEELARVIRAEFADIIMKEE